MRMQSKSSGAVVALLLSLYCDIPAAAPRVCNHSITPFTNLETSSDLGSSLCPDVNSCAVLCCADSNCRAFTFTTSQPRDTPNCSSGTPCCWLKSGYGTAVPQVNCTSGSVDMQFSTPRLTRIATIAADPSGHLRDPSAAVRDNGGTWHFWVDYIPLTQNTQDGWHAYLHHYTAPAVVGPWQLQGLAFNWSSDPNAFDSWGSFSPSALFDETLNTWFLFYSGTCLANYSIFLESAQLVASAASPNGPWTKLGLVNWPTGDPPLWTPQWNARRLDSGRALFVGGRRGYWTKGVRGASYAQEGVYFPLNGSSFLPPYAEWLLNPIYNASDNNASAVDGYENCEFFRGPDGEAGGPWLHVLCTNHGQGQPHFVTKDNLHWQYLGVVDVSPALEPTPAYAGTPSDLTDVSYFISRAESVDGSPLHIDLFNLSWV